MTQPIRPRLSLVLATMNRREQARAVIDGMLAEKRLCPGIELVVVDGGSTDGTVEMLRSYGDAIDRWVSGKNMNVYDAYNVGLSMSTGAYVRVLSDDDEYYPQRFDEILAYCESHPDEVVVAGADYTSFDRRIVRPASSVAAVPTRITCESFFRWPLFKGFCHETVFYPSSLLREYGGWKARYRVAGDVELLGRMLAHGVKMTLLPIAIMRRTVYATSISRRSMVQGLVEKAWIMSCRGFGPYVVFLVFRKIVRLARGSADGRAA
jgi:glycosyltransferase involved in cell wall biosynthesis